jgi:hypothetical protein
MDDVSDDTADTWTEDIEGVLKNILHNCNELQRRHKSLFLYYQSSLKYFQLPLIVLSSVNSVLAVTLSNYISQSKTSLVNCIFSLVCASISSVQLFLKLEDRMKQELQAYYNFKLLAIKIGSTLKLNPKNRDIDGSKFLDDCLTKYRAYFEGALVLSGKIDDKIVEMTERPNVIKNVLTGDIEVNIAR